MPHKLTLKIPKITKDIAAFTTPQYRNEWIVPATTQLHGMLASTAYDTIDSLISIGVDGQQMHHHLSSLGVYDLVNKRLINKGWSQIYAGWKWERVSLAWRVKMQATVGAAPVDELALFAVGSMALREYGAAAWALRELARSLVEVSADWEKHTFGPVTFSWGGYPLASFALALLCRWQHIECDISKLGIGRAPAYDAILKGWSDEGGRTAAIEAALELHAEHILFDPLITMFQSLPYHVWPAEILALEEVRRAEGLQTPRIDHPLTNNAMMDVPRQFEQLPDELLEKVEQRLCSVAPDLAPLIAGTFRLERHEVEDWLRQREATVAKHATSGGKVRKQKRSPRRVVGNALTDRYRGVLELIGAPDDAFEPESDLDSHIRSFVDVLCDSGTALVNDMEFDVSQVLYDLSESSAKVRARFEVDVDDDDTPVVEAGGKRWKLSKSGETLDDVLSALDARLAGHGIRVLRLVPLYGSGSYGHIVLRADQVVQLQNVLGNEFSQIFDTPPSSALWSPT